MELEKRVAIVTGASSGIGAVIARFYLNEGAFVYGCGLETCADITDENFAYQKANICDEVQAAAVVKGCQEKFGHVDILVNCAGVTGIAQSIIHRSKNFDASLRSMYSVCTP